MIINVIDDRFISQVRDHDLYDLAFAHVRVHTCAEYKWTDSSQLAIPYRYWIDFKKVGL